MTVDPRTPILIGAASSVQREDDPRDGLDALGLMAQAATAALEDSGVPALGKQVQWIGTPKGMWEFPDPGRFVADAIGAADARTILAEIGILQTTLLSEAADRIQRGELDVALVCGGEAKYRRLRGAITGTEAVLTDQGDAVPDETRRPHQDILEPLELARDFVWPVRQYAAMENALRAHRGESVPDHIERLSRFWARFSQVAATNPHAWNPAGASDQMLSWPYAKVHNSQWNVDQAAAVVLCAAGVAEGAGVPRERWIFPVAGADSNHMTTLTSRAELHRSPGFAVAGRTALDSAGLGVDDIDHLDLYSCFPVAVQIQASELGIDADRDLTVTGGMAFAGGPLNNYVYMAVSRMVEVLRERGGHGMVTAVSGFLTKQGVTIWSADPPPGPYRFSDVSDTTREQTALRDVDGDHTGPATVATYTVVHDDGTPAKLITVCDTPAGTRTLATSTDPELCAHAMAQELIGTAVTIGSDGTLHV